MPEVGVGARAVDDAGAPVREEFQLVVVAVVHVRRDGRDVEQPGGLREADWAAGETRDVVVPRLQYIPKLAQRAGVFREEWCFVGGLCQMR